MSRTKRSKHNRNRTTTMATDQRAIEGVRRNLQGTPVLYLAGKPYTPASIEDRVQARIDAATDILVKQAAWKQAVADYETLAAEVDLLLRDLKAVAIAMFSEQSPKLADFGFSARRKHVFSEEERQKMVLARLATRAARQTRGPKAKLAIKG